MRCENCGNDISYNEKICSNCGENNANYVPPPPVYIEQPQQTYTPQAYDPPQNSTTYQQQNTFIVVPPVQKDSKIYAILALVFGALGGWLGLLFGIIGLTRYKGDIHSNERVMCWIGIGLWVFWFIANIILLSTL